MLTCLRKMGYILLNQYLSTNLNRGKLERSRKEKRNSETIMKKDNSDHDPALAWEQSSWTRRILKDISTDCLVSGLFLIP